MKKQWKGFVCGFMAAILIVGMGTTALAATVRQLNASYSGIKISLDGVEFIPKDANGTVVEPFIVDGTTYLPVRAVASAFGLDVAWDGATQTVILTTPNNSIGSNLLYEDEFVKIEFDSIQESKYYGYACDAVLLVTNKTEYSLLAQVTSIAFDGIGYNVVCSQEISPDSVNKLYCSSEEEIPKTYSNCSGFVNLFDLTEEAFGEVSRKVTWTNK